MGIDRHEWEHRNYKSGRALKAAPALQPELEGDPLAHDASLGDEDAAAATAGKGKGAARKPAVKEAAKPAKGKAPPPKAARAR